MDASGQVREFLMSRRARVTPEQAGIPRGLGIRRVEGLRREEVAQLAGVSLEYYAQIERGDISRASEGILLAVARALQLNDVETDHLLHLAQFSSPRHRRETRQSVIHPNVQLLLDAMTSLPVSVVNRNLDLVATNHLARGVYSDVYLRHRSHGDPNLARFVFLDDYSRTFFPDWATVADDTTALLHAESAQAPEEKALFELIRELHDQSEAFRTRWAAHDVSAHYRGDKRIRHAEAGELYFQYESLQIPGSPGLQVVTFLTEPGSSTDEALRVLGSRSRVSGAVPAGMDYWHMPQTESDL